MSPARSSRHQILIATAFLTACLAPMVWAVPEDGSQAGAQSAEVQKMRSYAESQHEIVILLLRKNEYGQALAEANKIFALNWPQGQEATLRKDLLYLADQFLHGGQAGLGIQLIDTNLKIFKSNTDRAAILKEKGYLHKSLGQGDQAIDCFREAQRLEKLDK